MAETQTCTHKIEQHYAADSSYHKGCLHQTGCQLAPCTDPEVPHQPVILAAFPELSHKCTLQDARLTNIATSQIKFMHIFHSIKESTKQNIFWHPNPAGSKTINTIHTENFN